MQEDIFSGDKKLDNAGPKEESFIHAAKHIGKGLGVLFFKKFYMNLFIVLVVIAASVAITFYFKPGENITGNAVLECPETTCPECETPVCEEQACPELSCDEDCPEKTLTEYVYRYRCSNGAIVNSSDKCIGEFPETSPTYTSTSNGVSISLDSVYYEKDDGTIRIKQINYTIINQGEVEILPKVGLKVYDKYTSEVKDSPYLRTFQSDKVVGMDSWIIKSENINIEYEGEEGTVRLALINALPDPDEQVTAIYRKFDFS